MSNFGNHVLTDAGKSLEAEAHLPGRKLTFTKLAIGSGILPNPATATGLANHEMDLGITRVTRDPNNANWVRIQSVFNNTTLITGFNFQEIGVFAKIDNDPEIMYSWARDLGVGDSIPSYDGANPVLIYPTVIVVIDSSIDIHADITVGADFDCENIGPPTVGPGWFAQRVGNTFQFKRAVEGLGIDLIEGPDTVTIGQKILQVDLDLYVPTTHPNAPNLNVAFPDIQSAWDSLRETTIPFGRKATIHVAEGVFILNNPLNLKHPDGTRIEIIGADPILMPIVTGNGGVWQAGSAAGNWYFRLGLSQANWERISVDDLVAVYAPKAGGGILRITDGIHRVFNTNVAGFTNHITLQFHGRRNHATILPNLAPGAGISVWWFPTRLKTNVRLPAHTINIFSPGVGQIKNIAIRDTASGGAYSTINIDEVPARVLLSFVAIFGSEAAGLRIRGAGCNVVTDHVFIGSPSGNASCIQIFNGARLDTDNLLICSAAGYAGIEFVGGNASLLEFRCVANSTMGIRLAQGSSASLQGITGPWSYVQYNDYGLMCTGGSSARFFGNVFFGNHATNDIRAEYISAVTGITAGTSGATNLSPALDVVGNWGAVIAAL